MNDTIKNYLKPVKKNNGVYCPYCFKKLNSTIQYRNHILYNYCSFWKKQGRELVVIYKNKR